MEWRNLIESCFLLDVLPGFPPRCITEIPWRFKLFQLLVRTSIVLLAHSNCCHPAFDNFCAFMVMLGHDLDGSFWNEVTLLGCKLYWKLLLWLLLGLGFLDLGVVVNFLVCPFKAGSFKWFSYHSHSLIGQEVFELTSRLPLHILFFKATAIQPVYKETRQT